MRLFNQAGKFTEILLHIYSDFLAKLSVVSNEKVVYDAKIHSRKSFFGKRICVSAE